MTVATVTTLDVAPTFGRDSMDTVVRPPVNEVVLAASFEPQSVLDGPRLMVGLSDILTELPSISEVPPYEMPEELAFADQVLQPAALKVQFVASNQVQRRVWFTDSHDPAFLVQAQSNYFALNWRRQNDEHLYPGFEVLQEKFRHYFSMLQTGCIRQGGIPLQVTQIEVTYINILQPDVTWQTFRDLENIVSVRAPEMSQAEQLNFAYSRSIEDEVGSFFGRLHAAVATGYQPKARSEAELRPLSVQDLSPVVNLSVTARSGKIKASAETVEGFLDTAHEAATSAFKILSTDQALANWGLS
jgi:uncharacterized protein (TIGR04255 family)